MFRRKPVFIEIQLNIEDEVLPEIDEWEFQDYQHQQSEQSSQRTIFFNIQEDIISQDLMQSSSEDDDDIVIDHQQGLTFKPRKVRVSLDELEYNEIKFQKGNTQETCCICLNDFYDGEAILEVKCKHHYHSKCIGEWVKNQMSCPLCKAKIGFTLEYMPSLVSDIDTLLDGRRNRIY